MSDFPEVSKRQRCELKFTEAIHNTASPLQANIIAKRTAGNSLPIKELISPQIENIKSGLLTNIDKAASRIAKSLRRGEVIGLICDYNTEGISSAAIANKYLVEIMGFESYKVKTFITDKKQGGFGFSHDLVKRVTSTKPAPSLLITLNLSKTPNDLVSEYKSIMKSKRSIGDVITCENSKSIRSKQKSPHYALINPNGDGSKFPDKDISGSIVVMLLMIRAQKKLSNFNGLSKTSVSSLIPLVTCAVTSNSASLLSPTNRAFVKAGFKSMNSRTIPAWEAYNEHYISGGRTITSARLGTELIPDINSCSRAGDSGYTALKFLLSDNKNEARRYLLNLSANNKEKELIETGLVTTADYLAEKAHKLGASGISVYLPMGKDSSQQSIAKLIRNKYGKPAMVIIPKSHSEKELKLEELKHLRCDILNAMNAKEIFHVHKTNKELQLTLKRKGVMASGDFVMVATKENTSFYPTFELFSLTPHESVGEIDMHSAAKMTRKSLFQGIKKGIYNYESNKGKVVFDISKINSPKLFISRTAELKAEIVNFQGINGHEFAEQIQTREKKLLKNVELTETGVVFQFKADDQEYITSSFDAYARKTSLSKNIQFGVTISSDGEVPEGRMLDLSLVDEIRQLEPFGKGFEYPQFEVEAQVIKATPKEDNLFLRLKIKDSEYAAIWSDYKKTVYSGFVKPHSTHTFVIEPHDSVKNGGRAVMLSIKGIRTAMSH